MTEFKPLENYTFEENEFLKFAIEAIDLAILDQCKIKLAHPERLADILIGIGRAYAGANLGNSDDEMLW